MERRAEHLRVSIPRALMADAPEPVRGDRGERVEHFARAASQCQISMADNPRAGPARPIQPARRLRRDTIDEFHLAHRLQRLAIGRVVKRAALHEDRADDVVPAGEVGVELIEGVVRIIDQRGDKGVMRFGKHRDHRAQIPQVVVRVDNRQIGFEDILGVAIRRCHCSLPCAAHRRRVGDTCDTVLAVKSGPAICPAQARPRQ